MEWFFALLIVAFFFLWIFKLKKTTDKTKLSAQSAVRKLTVYEDYQDELRRKPIGDLDEEEQIVRRAHDAFREAQASRSAEFKAKQHALSADKKKIKRAQDFIETSLLDHALPFVEDQTRTWPSWIVNQNGNWTPPVVVSDLAKSDDGAVGSGYWIEMRPENCPLYRISFEQARIHEPDETSYGSMTLYVDGDEVLSMFVKNKWPSDRWEFAIVESLKVGPWIDGFIDFYTRLRSIKENEYEDRNADYIRAQAAKINLGGQN